MLLIPTVKADLSEISVCSFEASLARTSTQGVVVYNGRDEDVVSEISGRNITKIGFHDSEELAMRFAEIADCRKDLLFGKQEYQRSYGGASNLLLAVGYALGACIMCKVDDDSWDTRSAPTPSWLSEAVRLAQPHKVCFGPSSARTSQVCLSKLPEKTASELAAFIYSKDERRERLFGQSDGVGSVISNGNLVFMRDVLRSTCYPVLYEPATGTHARGEVCYWMYDLQRQGLLFEHQKALGLEHRHSREVSLNNWLRSTIVGFDLSLVFRTYKEQNQRMLTSPERRKAMAEFRSWILSADWPEEVDVEQLVVLLEGHAFDLTERFYSELSVRKDAWTRLTNSDLTTVVDDVLPTLRQDRC